ncbi:kinase-like protein, partial [Clavulina sp. PMI_390]
ITHSQLNHANVLPYLGVFHETAESPPLTIIPYIAGGSLQGLISPKEPLGADKFRSILLGIFEGIIYLHSLEPPVIHGDLHPGNVLLDEDGKAYLCDFGLSRIRHEVTRTRTQLQGGGQTRFLAPELTDSTLARFRTTWESDLYALAMLIFNMWAGERPFAKIELEWKVAVASVSGQRPGMPHGLRVAIPQVAEKLLWELLERMWAQTPLNRPPCKDALNQLKKIFNTKAWAAPRMESKSFHIDPYVDH